MEAEQQDHWTRVYRDKAPDSVSWYQPAPRPSLLALQRLGTDPTWSLIDIGGGASNLVDALLEQGWQDITVLDIAPTALEKASSRLGTLAGKVHWETADITRWQPTRKYDVWHDRAVFHFLTEPGQRDAYRKALLRGLSDKGIVLMATFAPDGPEKCSGLPVQRYDAESLARELGPSLKLIDSWREDHVTPWGDLQAFNWCAFRSARNSAT